MYWIQNFSRHVTHNMACWIDQNGTVHTLKSESLLPLSVLQWETCCILMIEWLSGLWGVSKLFLGQKMGRSKKKIAAWQPNQPPNPWSGIQIPDTPCPTCSRQASTHCWLLLTAVHVSLDHYFQKRSDREDLNRLTCTRPAQHDLYNTGWDGEVSTTLPSS